MQILDHVRQSVTLLVILSVLVVAHEWGHFIVARLCGIRVDDFSIGFGKRLFRIAKRGDTEYNVRMLPLGGFVKIAGMEPDEAPLVAAKDKVLGKPADPDAGQIPLIAENVGENTAYTAPDGFYSKPLWQRSLVILAGPVMSFVFGYVVFCLMGCTVGVPSGKVMTRIGLVEAGGEGQRIGLRMGDVITAIDGKPVTDGKDMIARINSSLGKTITLTFQRGGSTLTRTATPRVAVRDDKTVIHTDIVSPGSFGNQIGLIPGDTLGQIGKVQVEDAKQALQLWHQYAGQTIDVAVLRSTSDDPVILHGLIPKTPGPNVLPTLNSHPIGALKIDPAAEIEHMSLLKSVEAGTVMTGTIFSRFGEMIHRPSQLKENTGGIILMYQATGLAVKSGPVEELALAAQLSISLAIFNLLPIPILDGGHLLTFFIEWVRRGRRFTEQQQAAFLMTGLFIIGILFVLINSHDILRTLRHQLPQ